MPADAAASGLPRLFFGGAGGSGQRDYDEGSEEPCFGGFGGGVVLVLASTMTGTGVIDARGGNGPHGLAIGAGGGGAGGSVFLRTMQSDWRGRVDVRGGSGGDTLLVMTNAHYGAGGGGGGGRIYAAGTSFVPVVSGGTPGVNLNDPSTDWGARSGVSGILAPTSF